MIYILLEKPQFLKMLWLLISAFFTSFVLAQTPEAASVSTPSETSLVDFSSIREALANDLLEQNVAQVVKESGDPKKKLSTMNNSKFDYPTYEHFWSFASEFWLVKNVTLLRWNYEKPDYGIDQAFNSFLADVGYVEKKFKILLLESRSVFHLALPSDPGEVILLLSAPFLQELDLSKLEISILLFENFFRNELGQLKKKLTVPHLEKLIGSNFKNSAFNQEVWNQLQNEYDKIIISGGFSFQEQYEVTTQVGKILGNKTNHFDTYLRLLKKIENLTKGNPNYVGYNRIYPSPELQLKWLLPPKKEL